MKTTYKTYLFASIVLTIALLGIIFDEMHDHGWLTQPQVEVLSFVLSLWVVLTLGVVAQSVVRSVFKQFRPHPPGALIIALGIIAGFALLAGSDAPVGYYASAVQLGGLIGVIPALEFIIYADPLYGRLKRVGERLEARFGDGEVTR